MNANHIPCFRINKVLDINTIVSVLTRSMSIVEPISKLQHEFKKLELTNLPDFNG